MSDYPAYTEQNSPTKTERVYIQWNFVVNTELFVYSAFKFNDSFQTKTYTKSIEDIPFAPRSSEVFIL